VRVKVIRNLLFLLLNIYNKIVKKLFFVYFLKKPNFFKIPDGMS
jgi:hypothetical protein